MNEDEYMEIAHPTCGKLKQARKLLKAVRHKTLGLFDAVENKIYNHYQGERKIDFTSYRDVFVAYCNLTGMAKAENEQLIFSQEDINFIAACPETGNQEIHNGLKCQQEECNCWTIACYEWWREKKKNIKDFPE